MTTFVARLIGTLDRVVDYFIPPAIAADREARQRAHVFMVSHILGPVIGNTVPLALYIFDPQPDYPIAVLSFSITLFWIFPFLLRAGAPYSPLALVSVQNLIFCILWSCYFYGGVTSPTLPWVLTIPILAFFYLGSAPRLRAVVIVMFIVNFAFFYGLYSYLKPDNQLPLDAAQGLGLVSTCAASIYVTMMALYYAKVVASQGELETEMRGHLATAAKLRAATEEAERAGAAKAEFLAKMSHELRTPLNAVIGYSQMLLEDAEEEGDDLTVADLQKIHSAGHHLLKLVNEILDLSKIEAGKMELYIQSAKVSEIVDEIIAANKSIARARNIKVFASHDVRLGHVSIDVLKLRSVLMQLYDNALKFTENGRVTIATTLVDDVLNPRLELAISDTGIGIASNDIGRLFEHFTVVNDTSTSKYGGTGLGLALSQKLVALMGGDIVVTSELGVGSRFTIRLPAVKHIPPEMEAPSIVPAIETESPSVERPVYA